MSAARPRGSSSGDPQLLANIVDVRRTPNSRRRARSFNLPEAVVQRATNTMVGLQARTYGTDLMGRVPESLTRFVEEAIEDLCTQAEDAFNGGEPFPAASLTPGPGPAGAREGAEKRRKRQDPPDRERADEIMEAAGRR